MIFILCLDYFMFLQVSERKLVFFFKVLIPIDHWCYFADFSMHLNQGKFRKNGGCGYILKPDSLRNRGKEFVLVNTVVFIISWWQQ